MQGGSEVIPSDQKPAPIQDAKVSLESALEAVATKRVPSLRYCGVFKDTRLDYDSFDNEQVSRRASDGDSLPWGSYWKCRHCSGGVHADTVVCPTCGKYPSWGEPPAVAQEEGL